MKRLTIAAATVIVSLVAAAPSLAAGKNPPSSCGVGNVVSLTTQESGGIGKLAHEEGFGNVGNELIQPYHDTVCSN